MIYKIFTGQYIDMSHILTVSEPYISSGGFSTGMAFDINFLLREKAVMFGQKMPTFSLSNGDGFEQHEAAVEKFKRDHRLFLADWQAFKEGTLKSFV